MQHLGIRPQACDLILERWLLLARAEHAGQLYSRALAASVRDGGGRQYLMSKNTLQISAGGVRRVGAVRILSRRRLRWHVVVGLFPTAAADQ
jgi:hypothetical protein